MKPLVRLFSVIVFVTSYLMVKSQDCRAMQLRDLSDFSKLSNCVAVTGSLDIIFEFELIAAEDVALLTFPKLKEITGYLLIFQMPHLKNVGTLFPNLQLIRGLKLFSNYALILYDLPDLEEIGLINLIKINRGGVRIEKVPTLCYGPTLNWKALAPNGRFYIDKPYSPECPTNKICRGCQEEDEVTGYCWNSKNCQKYDHSEKDKLCPAYCFGGCIKSDDGKHVCSICRDIVEKGVCVKNCTGDNILNTETQRCVSVNECKLLDRKKYERLCLMECPKNYSIQKYKMKDDIETIIEVEECEKCERRCPKVCDIKFIIRKLSQLQQYEGCTIITTNLEISINEDIPNIMDELDKYLGGVEEVYGSLKVFRSNPIISLSFLNNLILVENNNTFAKSHFGVSIYENPNLQSLIVWENRTRLIVRRGGLQFHNNKMLCLKDIMSFRNNSIHNESFDLIDSNGNIKYCVNENIETKCPFVSYNTANISWWDNTTEQENYKYVIHYIQTTVDIYSSNYSFFEKDSCSLFSWHSIALTNHNITQQENGNISYLLTKLEPNTYYAYHVQIFTNDQSYMDPQTSSTHKQSPVNFFRTLIHEISSVINLRAINKTSDSVTLAWDVIRSEKDLVKYFIIDVIAMPDLHDVINRRNYCRDPIDYSNQQPRNKQAGASKRYSYYDECCNEICTQRTQQMLDEHSMPRRRSISYDSRYDGFDDPNEILSPENFAADMYKSFHRDATRPKKGSDRKRHIKKPLAFYSSYENITSFNNTFTVPHLLPFMSFAFQFFACSETNCSAFTYIVERTDRDATIDQVIFTKDDIEVHTEYAVLKFQEPITSNANITVSYLIEYKNLDTNYHKLLCLTNKEHADSNMKYTLNGIDPGNYTISVRAISLAGAGRPVEQFFVYTGLTKFHEGTSSSLSYILFSLIGMVLVSIVTFNFIYYRHQIKLLISRHLSNADDNDDENDLIEDVEPINFDVVGLMMQDFHEDHEVSEHEMEVMNHHS